MNSIISKARKIKLVIFDVDGVLTDGQLYFSEQGMAFKAFHVHDGVGIKMLLEAKIEVGIITHHDSPIVVSRMDKLGIKHLYMGDGPKMQSYETLIAKLALSDDEVAYVGDDLPDLPVIKRAGLGVAVANATSAVAKFADWQTKAPGGNGACREVCELILNAQNKMPESIILHLK